MRLKVPFEYQDMDFTCGPRSLRMVLSYFDRHVPLRKLMRLAGTTRRHGTSRHGMIRAMRALGFEVQATYGASINDLRVAIKSGAPPIVNHRDKYEWFGHYSVVVGVTNKNVRLHDPWHGPNTNVPIAEFERRWYGMHKTKYARWFLTARPR